MQFRRWCEDCRRRCCRIGARPIIGICCILAALLILLTCAPAWLAAVAAALLLLALGFWLL